LSRLSLQFAVRQCRTQLQKAIAPVLQRQAASQQSEDPILEEAESEKRKLGAQYEVAERGKPVLNDEPVTVEDVIHAFINEKKGGKAAQNTLANHELTSSRLEDFCTAKNIYFLNQITLEYLSALESDLGSVLQVGTCTSQQSITSSSVFSL